ncbi:MAG: trans-2,3-dihydro-3-hydroxyanthranilate isomerase [Pseudomonadota bacterium]|nr:trans-2,3-dihydro-3-hydroxyanthranilate isomerase [Pseudomonadota bacterium]
MACQYFIIDAFTRQKFEGAQIAVFPDAGSLNEKQMQRLAGELNLSETVFVCAATDGASQYRLRIFSPQQELDFAGHPVIAAGYVLQKSDTLQSAAVQVQLNCEALMLHTENLAGEIRVRFTVRAASALDSFVPSARELGEILHLDEKLIEQSALQPMLASCNGDYLLVPVKSEAAFTAAHFNVNKWTTSFVATLASQIILLCKMPSAGQAESYRVRLLGKNIGDREDPPVGSAAPAAGVYLFNAQSDGIHHALLQRGGDDRRKSVIEVTLEKSAGEVVAIHVGGYAVATGRGVIDCD